MFSDIRELKQKQNELNWIANHDPLTNIPNRRLFHQRLSQACAQSRRDKTPLALCMLDLDGFKPVNDLWGHDAGDALLIEIARRLQHSVRADEIVARLGGDEFVMFFRSPEGQRVFNRIREVIARPVTLPGGMETRVTASMGVAWFVSEDAVDETTLLQRADEALYQSKLNGRDCVTEWNQQT